MGNQLLKLSFSPVTLFAALAPQLWQIAGNWKSAGAAEGYIQKSNPMKRKIASIRAETIGLDVPDAPIEPVYPQKRKVQESGSSNGMVIHNQQIFNFGNASLDGCTFSFGAGTLEKTTRFGDKENQPPLVLKFSRKQASDCNA